MKCSACDNPYHPAPGHRWTAKVVLCGVCARDWFQWLKGRMGAVGSRKKGMKSSFEDNAVRSIIGD